MPLVDSYILFMNASSKTFIDDVNNPHEVDVNLHGKKLWLI